MSDISRGEVGPHFDDHEMATGGRTQRPGTLVRDPREVPQNIEHERMVLDTSSRDVASDKYGIITMNVDASRAFQLIPAEQMRKTALFNCFNFPIYFGDESSISNILGQTNPNAQGVFYLPPSTTTSLIAIEYTSKQGLYVCGAGGVAAVQCLVERFTGGTPVR